MVTRHHDVGGQCVTLCSCGAGEGPVLELLQRGPGRAGGLRLPQPAREAALGHAHAVRPPRVFFVAATTGMPVQGVSLCCMRTQHCDITWALLRGRKGAGR